MHKITILTWILLLLACRQVTAQDVTVKPDAGAKITLDGNDPDKPHKQPFMLKIDKAFKGKSIGVYTVKNNDGKVGTIVSDKDDFQVQVRFNEINVGGQKIILGDGGHFFLELDGKYTLKISYEKDKEEKPKQDEDETGSGKPGFIIYDALTLAKEAEKPAPDMTTVKKILTVYEANNHDVEDNKWLPAELRSYKTAMGINAGETHSNGLSAAMTAIGGLDVTNIADGFAKFIVKRTKEELSIAYFKKFKEELSKYPDLKDLFPATTALLLAIDEQIYDYSKYINNLREAFRSDLLVLDEHLPAIVKNHPEFFKESGNFELGLALRTGCYISSSLRHDMHPGDILDGYPLSYFDNPPGADKDKLANLESSIQSLQLFSESLREQDKEKGNYWVSMDKVRELVNNKTAVKIYIGLLLQRSAQKYTISFDKSNLYNILNEQPIVDEYDKAQKYYNDYKEYFITLGNHVQELNSMVKDQNEDLPTDSARVEQYAKYFKTSVQFIEYCTQVVKLPGIRDIKDISKVTEVTEPYFNITYNVTDLTTAIVRKRYPEVVNHAVAVYQSAYALKVAGDHEKRKTENKTSVLKQTKEERAAMKTEDEKADTTKSTSDALVKYGAMMATVVTAQNSDDVAQAIEAAALPAGSARIKRESRWNVAINAYCGLFVGNEVIKGLDADKPFERFNSFGLTAPIGISFSQGDKILPWPLSYLSPVKGFSSTWFISLVDLGAVAAFRFTDDSTQQIPTIQLKDIFSPGLFWSVGIPRSPVSVNFGAQIGPNLRKVTATSNDFSDNMYIRYSMSVCVDLPLLNIANRSK